MRAGSGRSWRHGPVGVEMPRWDAGFVKRESCSLEFLLSRGMEAFLSDNCGGGFCIVEAVAFFAGVTIFLGMAIEERTEYLEGLLADVGTKEVLRS